MLDLNKAVLNIMLNVNFPKKSNKKNLPDWMDKAVIHFRMFIRNPL